MSAVVFIGGAGRSGSTLLERRLGSFDGWFSVGEVRYFWEYMSEGGHRCGCGEELSDCGFWSAVLSDLGPRFDVDEIADLARRLDRSRHGLWLHALFGDDFERLRRATAALYSAIAERSGAGVVVDSSKAPCHLQLLLAVGGLDLRVIRLVRDGRAVAHAWNRRQKSDPGVAAEGGTMPRRSLSRAGLAWAWEVALTEVVSTEARAAADLRYEDLVADPAGQLHRVLEDLGLGTDLDLAGHGRSWPVVSTHSVGGNPIRFDRELVVESRPEAWRDELAGFERALVSAIAAPELLRHGYRVMQDD